MRERFWKKLNEEGRSFIWFFNRYVKDKTELKYNTIYQQAKGETLTVMSTELSDAMVKFLGE
jgi:3-methyladenine DNA glycosylase Tag